ncbi:MAG: hypothetical protein V1716_02520 [Candidatus Uhrbacteria bacterium]
MKLYFGFGANRDTEMITAITGQKPFFGFPAKIKNFELCSQAISQMPKPAQKNLKECWDENFLSYGIRPNFNESVKGTIWLLTNKQREAVCYWELTGLWSKKIKTTAFINIAGLEIPIKVETEFLPNQEAAQVSGQRYKTFIVPKEKLIKIAIQSRNLLVPGVVV